MSKIIFATETVEQLKTRCEASYRASVHSQLVKICKAQSAPSLTNMYKFFSQDSVTCRVSYSMKSILFQIDTAFLPFLNHELSSINRDICVSDQRINHHKNLPKANLPETLSIPPQDVYLQVRTSQ